MAIPNQIEIANTTNNVTVQTNNNQITVVNESKNIDINILQPAYDVIQVAIPGPAGPPGITPILETGSLASTGSNNFVGNQIITGSVTATLGFTGSLFGTASFATTSSYVLSPSSDTQVIYNDSGSLNGSSLFVYDKNLGRVNIGTTMSIVDNGIRLHVGHSRNGSSGILITNSNTGSSAGAQLLMRNDAGFAAQWYAGSSTSVYGNNILFLRQIANGEFRFVTDNVGQTFYFGNDLSGGSPYARIGSSSSFSGNVSIGTTGPSARLQVRGSGATSSTTALLVQNSNASASLTVLDNGRVGINTGSAQFNLDVVGNVGVSNDILLTAVNTGIGLSSALGAGTKITFENTGLVTNGIRYNTNNTSNKHKFQTGGVDQLYIDGLTNSVGIRTTTPAFTLDVSGSGRFTNGLTVTGSLTVTNNLTVLGSASIQYISESVLNIGTNLITVNTLSPTVRFGGLAVIDSGSSPLGSGSFLYDSVQDEFIFVHRGDGTNITSSHFLVGPETYNNLGNEIYVPNNTLLKSQGNEHVTGSNITDTGTFVNINSNTSVTGSLTVTGSIRSSFSTGFNNTTTDGGLVLTNPVVGSVAMGVTSDGALRIKNNLIGTAFINASDQIWIQGNDIFAFNSTGIILRSNITNTTSTNNGSLIVRNTVNYTNASHVYNALSITSTITGSAGVVGRGLYVNPTLTSSIDFRAIETTAGSILFQSGSTPLLFVGSNGNVGIGTSTPTSRLDINNTLSSTVGLTIASPQTSAGSLVLSTIGTPGINNGALLILRHADGTFPTPGVTAASRVISSQLSQYFSGSSYVTATNIIDLSDGKKIFGATPSYGGTLTYYGKLDSGNWYFGDLSTTIGTARDRAVSSRVQIQGSGATSSTTAFRVENSNASASLVVLDNGRVGINTGSAAFNLDVTGTTNLQASNTRIRVENDNGGGITMRAGLFQSINMVGTEGNVGSGTGTLLLTGNSTTTDNGFKDVLAINQTISTPASNFNALTLAAWRPSISQSRGIIRGIYYNPTITHFSGGTHMFMESTAGDVLFQSGSSPLFFVSQSGNVSVGTTSSLARFHVRGSGSASTSTAFRVENNSGTAVLTILDNATTTFQGTTTFSSVIRVSNILPLVNDNITLSATWADSQGVFIRTIKNKSQTLQVLPDTPNDNTSGTSNVLRVTNNFSPTSGTGSNNALLFDGTINQTSASGSIRGLYYNPTITSISGSHRAIETTSGDVLFQSGSTSLLFISSSGNVGVGTTTPLENLHVSGNILIGNYASSLSLLRFANVSNSGNSAFIGRQSAGDTGFVINGGSVGNFLIQIPPGSDTSTLTLQGNGVRTAQFYRNQRIRFGGNLTTNPPATLQIIGEGATSSTTALLVQNSNATASLTVLDNGRVAINTGSAAYTLDVNGIARVGDSTTSGQFYVKGFPGSGQYIYLDDGSKVWSLIGGTNYTIQENGTTRFIVREGGNVGIRQSSPTYGLDIAGTTTLDNNIIRIQPGSNAMSPQFIIDDGSERRLALGTNSSGGIFSSGNLNYAAVLGSPAGYDIQFFTINTARMTILAANGNVGIGTNAPTARLDVSGSGRFTSNVTVTGSVIIDGGLFDTITTGSLPSGSHLLYSFSTASYQAGFFDYYVTSGSNFRAGTIMSVAGAGTYRFTDQATPDIGDTTNLQFSMSLATSNLELYASASSNGWTVKTTFRTI